MDITPLGIFMVLSLEQLENALDPIEVIFSGNLSSVNSSGAIKI